MKKIYAQKFIFNINEACEIKYGNSILPLTSNAFDLEEWYDFDLIFI